MTAPSGGSSTSAKSFFVHHTQQLAAAAQVGDAKGIRKKITEMKMRLTYVSRTRLKEESEFRNERDVVPAGIRTGPNPQIYFFCFLGKVIPCNETPRSRVFRVF